GEKILYLRDDDTMTRAQTPTGSATAGRSVGNGSTRDWRLAPVLAKDLHIPRGNPVQRNATVSLRLASNCAWGGLCGIFGVRATIAVELRYGSGTGTSIGISGTQSITSTSPTTATFSIPIGADHTIPAGTPLYLRIHNTGNESAQVYQYNGGRSTVSFFTSTVINVDSVLPYPAAWGGSST